MKLKRILSALLACLMLTGILAVGANAWTAPEKKTEAKHVIPGIGQYLAMPGEWLITKLLLPKLLKGMTFDLLGGAFTSNAANAALASTAADLEEKMTAQIAATAAGPLLAKFGGTFPAGTMYYVFSDDAPDSVKVNTAKAETINQGVTWNVTDKASFIEAMCTILRPAVAAGLAADIVAEFDSVYVPGLKALGATTLASKAALQAQLQIFGQKTMLFSATLGTYLQGMPPNPAVFVKLNAEERAAVDVITKAVIEPMLEGLGKIGSTDVETLLFRDLPNLLYGVSAIDTMLETEFVSKLMGSLGVSADTGFGMFFEDMIGGALADLLGDGVKLDIKGLLKKLTYAGDLVDGQVVADKSLIYNVLVNFLYDSLDKNAIVPLLGKLLGNRLPNFLVAALFYVLKGFVWLLRM